MACPRCLPALNQSNKKFLSGGGNIQLNFSGDMRETSHRNSLPEQLLVPCEEIVTKRPPFVDIHPAGSSLKHELLRGTPGDKAAGVAQGLQSQRRRGQQRRRDTLRGLVCTADAGPGERLIL